MAFYAIVNADVKKKAQARTFIYMNLMQGWVLIFHTRAVTLSLGFSCLVQFNACVVVKAIYLLLFICFIM